MSTYEHHVRTLSRSLAEIAHTLEGVDALADRIDRVLVLAADVVPYARIALLDLEEAAHRLFVVPDAELRERDEMHATLLRAWRLIVADADHSLGRSRSTRPSLTLPVMGLDEIIGIIRVEPPAGLTYEATHLRLLSVIAAQLGAYLTMVRMRQDQTRRTAELAAANEFQQLLAGAVGHDLRSPLTVIQTAAEMLRTTTNDPKQARWLERVLRSARQARRLISDLVDATEVRVHGSLHVAPEAGDARAIVEDCVAEARLVHNGHTIEFVASAATCEGVWDADRLAQAVTNLINNAVFHGAKTAPIRVSLDRDDEHAIIAVHNVGPPIEPALMPTIFDPFKRGHHPVTKTHGLGLGLFIVHHIVNAHGGSIDVRSSEQEGTTFRLLLPRHAITAQATRPEADRLILVVDDDEAVRTTLAGLLEARGYRVACAADGQEALDLLEDGLRPRMLLVDLHMPRLDGAELAMRCRRDADLAGIPIVFVTADAARALEMSNAVVAKPVQAAELERILASLGGHVT